VKNVSASQYIDTSEFVAEYCGVAVDQVIFTALGAALACVVVMPFFMSPVSRIRLERFASRQALDITADNGNLVIAYLAITRRWRGAGMLVATAIVGVWSLDHNRLSVNGLALFAGWFAGAVVAEWRVSIAASGSLRAASRVPRRRSDYLRAPARTLPLVAVLVCLTVALVDAIGGLAGRNTVWLTLASWLLATAAGLALVYAVQHHVLTRPQPVVAADVLAADAAIRARSLQVIAGCAVAAAGIPAAVLIGALRIAFPQLGSSGVSALATMTGLIVVIVGWLLARAPIRRLESTAAYAVPVP
jgi:hypothetical protein